MRIVVCGSMTASKKMASLERELFELGHEVDLPRFTKVYAGFDDEGEMHSESAENKVKYGLIRHYFGVVREGDAVLVVNECRHGIPNYVGGSTLIEMAFAHVLDKPVYLLNSVPDMQYRDEIEVMTTEVLNGDLTKIKC